MNMQNKSIIQWKGRNIKLNYEEIKQLFTDHNPNIICFQETFLKETNISFKDMTSTAKQTC